MIAIRPARLDDAAGIASVHVETWRTTYAGIVPQDFLDGLNISERTRRWESNLSQPVEGISKFNLVADHQVHGIVGFITGGKNRAEESEYDAELWAIYVLASHHGQGIGRMLTEALVAQLAALGMKSMLVWVLRDNQACRFYEALGGLPVHEKSIEIGGAELAEIGYGWPDIRSLSRAKRA